MSETGATRHDPVLLGELTTPPFASLPVADDVATLERDLLVRGRAIGAAAPIRSCSAIEARHGRQ